MRPEQAEMARYVGQHARELARMAQAVNLETLTYLLEMTVLEAQNIAPGPFAKPGK
jgi:hypothetical protein